MTRAKAQDGDKDDDKTGEQYRNRAQERREGNLGDYAESERMLATVM